MTPGSITALVRTLVAVGATPEQILAAVETAEATKDAATEESRAKARARVKKWRDSQSETARNVTKRSVVDTSRLTRAEDSSSTSKISGKKENKNAAALSDLAAFKADLETDCSPEQVDSFAKHRKAKNGQNSAYAAKLFRRDAAACGMSPSQAIDVAVSRGWLTVKPEYLKGRPNSTAPPKPLTQGESIRNMAREKGIIDATGSPIRHLETSDRDGENPGVGDIIRLAVAGNHRW